MEFKGTKGKWQVSESPIGLTKDVKRVFKSIKVGNGITGKIVANTYSGFGGIMITEQSKEEVSANALLISKAPEMLEMLKRNLETVEKLMLWSEIPAEDRIQYTSPIKNLIKEATEL